MRAVIYCRVSTVEQAQNLSLSTQEQACREYCARQGYHVDQVFIDAGESARTTERPEFRRLLEHCRLSKGTLHAVLVYSLTRFSRNSTDHHAIQAVLRGLGISLRSVTEPIDDSPSGRLMEGVLAAMAQFDNDVRADRVRAGLRAAVDRGRWCWQAPIGYLNADARKGPSLVPDPQRAPAVRAAFELYAAGVTGRALLQRGRAMGLTPKGGGSPISLSPLYNLLRQRAYIARIQPKGWPAEAIGDFAPLIPDELFARVQAYLNRPTRARRTARRHVNHPDFPLRRFVRCGNCASALTGSWSTGRTKTRYAFYACPRGCRRIAKAVMESGFLALLDTLQPRPGVWRLLEATVLDVWRAECQQADAAEAAARSHVAHLDAKLARLDRAFLYDRSIDDTTYHAQRDLLREDVGIARMELSQAAVDEMDVDGMLAFAQYALAHASALWTAASSVDERLRVQWVFFPEGLVLAPVARGSKSGRAFAPGQRGAVGTVDLFAQPQSCLRLFHLQPTSTNEGLVVDPVPPTWKQIHGFLQQLATLQRAA